LAAAGFAALLPGAIKFEVPNALKASGALAVFAVILWLGENKAPPDQVNLAMNSFLNFPSDSGPSSPFDSDVYVYVNDKLAKADVLPSHTASPAKEDPQRSDTIKVMRGAGGLRIDFDKLLARDRIYVVVRSDNGEWRSDDLVIPESNFTMRRH
jgi:hypothetical protein